MSSPSQLNKLNKSKVKTHERTKYREGGAITNKTTKAKIKTNITMLPGRFSFCIFCQEDVFISFNFTGVPVLLATTEKIPSLLIVEAFSTTQYGFDLSYSEKSVLFRKKLKARNDDVSLAEKFLIFRTNPAESFRSQTQSTILYPEEFTLQDVIESRPANKLIIAGFEVFTE